MTVAALDALMLRIRAANDAAAYYDQWEHGGSSSATPAQRAAMDKDLADAQRDAAAARAALPAAIAAARATAPKELTAWVARYRQQYGIDPTTLTS